MAGKTVYLKISGFDLPIRYAASGRMSGKDERGVAARASYYDERTFYDYKLPGWAPIGAKTPKFFHSPRTSTVRSDRANCALGHNALKFVLGGTIYRECLANYGQRRGVYFLRKIEKLQNAPPAACESRKSGAR